MCAFIRELQPPVSMRAHIAFRCPRCDIKSNGGRRAPRSFRELLLSPAYAHFHVHYSHSLIYSIHIFEHFCMFSPQIDYPDASQAPPAPISPNAAPGVRRVQPSSSNAHFVRSQNIRYTPHQQRHSQHYAPSGYIAQQRRPPHYPVNIDQQLGVTRTYRYAREEDISIK